MYVSIYIKYQIKYVIDGGRYAVFPAKNHSLYMYACMYLHMYASIASRNLVAGNMLHTSA
jgi:hypothetical protein